MCDDVILFVGGRNVGKTSILSCLFLSTMPHETTFLEPSSTPITHTLTIASLPLHLMDIPHEIDPSDIMYNVTTIAKRIHIIAIVDLGDTTQNSISSETFAYLHSLTATLEHLQCPHHALHIFLHKMDCCNYVEDDMLSTCSHVRQLCSDSKCVSINFTSIYDHSLSAAMSTIIRSFHPQTMPLTHLANTIVTDCHIHASVMCFDKKHLLLVALDTYTPTDPSLQHTIVETLLMITQCMDAITNSSDVTQASINLRDTMCEIVSSGDIYFVLITSSKCSPSTIAQFVCHALSI